MGYSSEKWILKNGKICLFIQFIMLVTGPVNGFGMSHGSGPGLANGGINSLPSGSLLSMDASRPRPMSSFSGSGNSELSPFSVSCDFETYEQTGCEDEEGSICRDDACVCKEGFNVRLLAYCLPAKRIGDDCYTSSQCRSIDNASCYIFGKLYDNERISGGHNVGRQVTNWPTGTCRCNIGFQWDNRTQTCIKKTIGSWCNDDWDCIKDTFNTQCSRPQNLCECAWGFFYDQRTGSCQVPKLYGSKCISNTECEAENLVCSPQSKCVCPLGFHFDPIHPRCRPNDDSSCDFGYKWDSEWGRCIPARSAAAAVPFNQITPKKTPIEPSSGSTPEEDSSSLSTVLLLVLPNLVAFALILRYCYFRKREDDNSDDEDDIEGGNMAIRAAQFHHLTKFCAYPPYRGKDATGVYNGGSCCGPPPTKGMMGGPVSLIGNNGVIAPKGLESVKEETEGEATEAKESITASELGNDSTQAIVVEVTRERGGMEGEGKESDSLLQKDQVTSELVPPSPSPYRPQDLMVEPEVVAPLPVPDESNVPLSVPEGNDSRDLSIKDPPHEPDQHIEQETDPDV